MICEGSSTKSQYTFGLASERVSVCVSKPCKAWPNSWNKVSTSSKDKSEGAVEIYFVAFDTSPEKFSFLKAAGGDVIGAGTGVELRKALDGIYQGKILAEAVGGEREPGKK